MSNIWQALIVYLASAELTVLYVLGHEKPVFRVSDQVQHKPSCTAIEDG